MNLIFSLSLSLNTTNNITVNKLLHHFMYWFIIHWYLVSSDIILTDLIFLANTTSGGNQYFTEHYFTKMSEFGGDISLDILCLNLDVHWIEPYPSDFGAVWYNFPFCFLRWNLTAWQAKPTEMRMKRMKRVIIKAKARLVI